MHKTNPIKNENMQNSNPTKMGRSKLPLYSASGGKTYHDPTDPKNLATDNFIPKAKANSFPLNHLLLN